MSIRRSRLLTLILAAVPIAVVVVVMLGALATALSVIL
jgi:hypothetical protein